MRLRRMVAPINSIKHYVHRSNVGIATGTITNVIIVDAVVAPGNATPQAVTEGSVIKAVYLEFWLASNAAEGAETQFTLTVEKKRSLEAAMTNAQANNLGAYPNKKNILYTTQGIVNSNTGSGAVPVIRQYVLIPKGKQRFGLDDQFVVNIAAVGALQLCGISTYKEYK